MSFKLKIFREITRGRSLEALFNQFNNVIFSSSRKSVPAKTCNHLFGRQMGNIQDYSDHVYVGVPELLHSLYHIHGKQHQNSPK